MSKKKDFTGKADNLLGGTKTKRGRPKTQTKAVNSSSQIGTKESETRATFIVNEDLLDKVKAIAYEDRLSIKEVVAEALEQYVKKKKPKARPLKERQKEQEKVQRLMKTGSARLPKF